MVCALPDRSLPAVATFFAILGFKILRIRRRVTLENLRQAFPEREADWHLRTAFRAYRHFSQMMLEFMKMNTWSEKRLLKLVDMSAIQALPSPASGQGAVMVSGHFGNWEVAIGAFKYFGYRTIVIQNRQKNPLVNQRMLDLRKRWGMEIVYPRGAVNACNRALRRGKAVALLGDQDAGKQGVFVPFFNRLSSTHVGAAIMQAKSQAPFYFGVCIRVAPLKYRFILLPYPDIESIQGLPLREKVRLLTAWHTAMLEKWVRRYPEQYFWMHRRWKTSPPAKKAEARG